MKVFFADNDSYPLWAVKKYELDILTSYAYPKACMKWFGLGRSIMLDSGAFTASTKGIVIDINNYIRFYETYKDSIITLVNLDVIPVKFEEAEIDKSAERGWENYLYMKSKNLPVIHVYHQGEKKKWLTKLMDESEYFGVSPNDKFSTRDKLKWLTETFSYICDNNGNALRKTHGFGVAGKSFTNFPFYSVDSSKPVQLAARKSLLINFGNEYRQVELGKKYYKDSHFDSLIGSDKQKVLQFLSEFNFSINEVRKDTQLLRIMNAISLRNMYNNEKEFNPQQYLF